MRLHELAKEIGAESKALLKLAKELGLNIRNHSSNLAVGEIAILKAAYREEFGDTTPEEDGSDEASPATRKTKKKRVRRKKAAARPADGESAEGEEVAAEAAAIPSFSGDDELDVDGEHATEGGETRPAGVDVAEPAKQVRYTLLPEASAPDQAEQVETGGSAPVDSEESAPPPQTELSPAARKQEPAAEGADQPGDSDGEGDPAPPSPKPAAPKKPAAEPKKKLIPTPRKRTGAKIVGRIELPPEEINKPRGPRPGFGSVSDPSDPVLSDQAGSRFGRAGVGRTETAEEKEAERRRGAQKRKDDPISWSPDDEDDPLLQGIRIRNIQTGPHTRRPPRRVGPRKTRRRAPAPLPSGPIDVQVPISVRDLSQVLGVKAAEILRILMKQGVMAHVNYGLDEEGILEVATALNREVNLVTEKGKEEAFLEHVEAVEKELAEKDVEAGDERLISRAPVVAFLGHVDHGKTSLLDRIRQTNVAAGEAGGITQSMRAYSVPSPAGGTITFLDTPGHKAFTEMRARGANTTDIVVLVVAADDGVMPQTEEAVQHALAANVPIVVAVNKIDRPESDAQKVMQQLAQVGVMVEGWGGEVQVAQVSAITGEGMDDLLEKITLQAEIMDLRADPERPARGTVIESKKDVQLGAVATVLVQEGTLRSGDVVLSGSSHGRVRTLINDQGDKIDEAGPSTPVYLVGLSEAPDASSSFYVVESLKKARDVAEERERNLRQERVSGPSPTGAITLENLFANLEEGKAVELNVVLRCDVNGSLEVLRRSLDEINTTEVKVKLIRDALGGITEDDVLLALASQAVVLGFNVVPDEKARALAESKGVEIRTYEVIYQLIDDMKAAMEGALSPLKKEIVTGHVEIREVFKVSRIGSIAGCRVQDGMVKRNSTVRLTRDGRIIYTGKLDSLKRFKDDVREVKEGMECGLKVAGYDDIKVGDVLEVIEVTEEKRTLDFANP